jgi:hypothetical protein
MSVDSRTIPLLRVISQVISCVHSAGPRNGTLRHCSPGARKHHAGILRNTAH